MRGEGEAVNYRIEFIPASQIRKEAGPTAGDYFVRDGEVVIQIADTGNRAYNLLVAHHEFTERMLNELQGVKDEDVDAFDVANADCEGEPGDLIGCPYGFQHQIATSFERCLCAVLGIPWAEYDQSVATGAANQSATC